MGLFNEQLQWAHQGGGTWEGSLGTAGTLRVLLPFDTVFKKFMGVVIVRLPLIFYVFSFLSIHKTLHTDKWCEFETCPLAGSVCSNAAVCPDLLIHGTHRDIRDSCRRSLRFWVTERTGIRSFTIRPFHNSRLIKHMHTPSWYTEACPKISTLFWCLWIFKKVSIYFRENDWIRLSGFHLLESLWSQVFER